MKASSILILLFAAFLMSSCAASRPTAEKSGSPAVRFDQTLEAQLDKLASEISNSTPRQQKSRIAVIEFSDVGGQVTNLGRFVAEELTTRLFSSGRFHVVERQLIVKLLQEQHLSMSGLVDEKTAKRAGAVLGVDLIATGTVTDLGPKLRINARVIETETGAVFAVASADFLKNDQLTKLQGTVAEAPAGREAGSGHNLTGTRKFVCCSGKYWGETELTQEGNKIQGQWYDMANKSGGTIAGSITGNRVLFTRANGEQDYNVTLSADGNTMLGFFVGSHDGSVGTEVTLTRK